MYPDDWSVCRQSSPLVERMVWRPFHRCIHTRNVHGGLSNSSVCRGSGLRGDFHYLLGCNPGPPLNTASLLVSEAIKDLLKTFDTMNSNVVTCGLGVRGVLALDE